MYIEFDGTCPQKNNSLLFSEKTKPKKHKNWIESESSGKWYRPNNNVGFFLLEVFNS